uniref:WD_REPEATS_REGION domain-containing protein n=1 Tax=Panagrellus redivivus TaxID=6233 RepID=A0A7E4V0B2_PANRE
MSRSSQPRTELKAFIFLSKKLSVPFTKEIKCVAWNYNRGFICAGGVDGTARVFKLHADNVTADKSNSNPFYMNSPLDGYGTSTVVLAAWNEYYQKLATSDDNGMIIVWSPQSDNTWGEEMVNNRNKSVIVDMKWSHDGNRVAIVYEDGEIIVGSLDGTKIYSKDAAATLCACAFSPDNGLLLVGLNDGEVNAYDSVGNFSFKVMMAAIESVDLDVALSNNHRKDMIVGMDYYAPPMVAKDPEPRGSMGVPFGNDSVLPSVIKPDTFEKNYIARARPHPDRPRFAVIYHSGTMQLMKNEMDTQPIVIREKETSFKQCHWSPDGTIIAVSASSATHNVLFLYTPYGEKLQYITLPVESEFSAFTWKSDGLMIGCAQENNLYLANVKPRYKWAYCHHTLVYFYEKLDYQDDVLVFYETKMNDYHPRFARDIISVTSYKEFCIICSYTGEIGGPYQIQLCNSIGTPLDQINIPIEPKVIGMNDSVIVAADYISFIVWSYSLPRGAGLEGFQTNHGDDISADQKCVIYNIDMVKETATGRPMTSRRSIGGTIKESDNIRSICVGKTFFLIARDNQMVHRFNLLPQLTHKSKFNIGLVVEQMALNCSDTRLAIITIHNTLKFFDIQDSSIKVVPQLEKIDVWDMKWDSHRDDLIAIMHKSRLCIVQDNTVEERVIHRGYIASFQDLTVRMVDLHALMQTDAKHVEPGTITDIEVKSLQKAKELLDGGKVGEASAFIEQHSHPKLWALLAKHAMNNLDLKTAETAFVRLKDFLGISFLRKLSTIHSDAFKRAEVHAFYGEYESAEKIYITNDRIDLAIDMYRRRDNWQKVLELIKKADIHDESFLMEAYKRVGDYYVDRQKWSDAAIYYEYANHYDRLVDCYIRLDDFGKMEQLAGKLPDGSENLKRLAEHFASAGLCELAVECFCDMMETSLDTCIRLNQWDKAVELSKIYHLRDVESLLSKYTDELTGSNEKALAAVQLFRKAGKYLQGARKMFDMAKEESKHSTAKRLKKLYVLGALLVEMHRERSKSKLGDNSATGALEGLLEEDKTLSMADARLMDTAWHGAEAWHFYMLAHRQLYDKQYDAALKTCLIVAEYTDLIDPCEVNCMLALVSIHAGQYATCSKAFMTLEKMPTLSDDERDRYKQLAIKIFLENPPIDTREAKMECTTCEAVISDCSIVCPNPSCNTRFPTCIVSGRPLLDYQFWLCPSCKHRAYEQEIQAYRYCPLCHFEI